MSAVISVIGSLNVDLVTRTKRVPVGGETLTSESFDIGNGGKGANQAVACARLSRSQSQAVHSQNSDVEVRMIGAVGEDQFAQPLLDGLKKDGLNVDSVEVLKGKKTGVAVILVETETGQNRILFNAGANYGLDVTRDLVPNDSTVALFQLEFPLEAVLHNMKLAREKGVVTVINPAPASPIPEEAYQGLGHLIVNETEAAIMSGVEGSTDWDHLAGIFVSRGVENVIITLGGDGVFYQTDRRHAQKLPGRIVPARKVNVVDTTAAGDTFVGAYTVAIARWKAAGGTDEFNLDAAIAHANRAASLTVQREGAQSSIPWKDEVPAQ